MWDTSSDSPSTRSIHPSRATVRGLYPLSYDVIPHHKVSCFKTDQHHWPGGPVDTPPQAHYIRTLPMSVPKIQIGQLWKKDGTGDTYLVTRVYSEALSTMVILRKSGSEEEALTRVRAERTATGQNIPGFSPAQENETR